jgi:3-oxoacyl-[acyl-carrier-protein] synthase-3
MAIRPRIPFPGPYKAHIIGTGSFLPEKTLTNEDLEKIVDTNDEWITTRTGIKVRHIASDDETTATLAAEAAKRALEDAKLAPEDIDIIVVATITPEMGFPSTACFVQDAIGAKNAWAFDLAAACSGFVYAMNIAQHFLISGRYNNILIIGAETLSRITDYEDRMSCILFGDGAGAVVIQKSETGTRGIMYSSCTSDGGGWTTLNCKAYGSRNPVGKPLENPKDVYMEIRGKETYQLAVRRIVELIDECLTTCKLTVDDIKMFIPHQMNARIIESVGKRLELPKEKVFVNIHKYGNTSAATIPIAMDECRKQGLVETGDYVLLVAFGGGLTWGANVIQF